MGLINHLYNPPPLPAPFPGGASIPTTLGPVGPEITYNISGLQAAYAGSSIYLQNNAAGESSLISKMRV